jgi:FtsH-binding integral membrane protein
VVGPPEFAAVFRTRRPLAILSVAAVLAGLGYFFNALPYDREPATNTIQFDLKISSFLWTGAWLLSAAAVLALWRSARPTQSRDGAPDDRRTRYLAPVGLGLALIGTDALMCAVGMLSPESSLSLGLFANVGLVAGLVGDVILARTAFALASRSALGHRETGVPRPGARWTPGFVVIDLAVGLGIAIGVVGWALENGPTRIHRLSPVESLLLTVLGAALAAGTVLFLARRRTRRQRPGHEPHRLPATFWLSLAVGFALVVSLMANALLTQEPLIGVGPPSLTTAYAAYAVSFGVVAITLFAAAARRRDWRRDLTVAGSGFAFAMSGSIGMGVVLQIGGSPPWAFAALTVTGFGFLVIATAAGHRALGTRRPPQQTRDPLWVGAVPLGPRLPERGAIEV